MKDGLYSLNPMDYHGTYFLQSLDLFWMDIFEIILLPFSWTLNSKIECPQRRYVFPKFNPCTQCIKNLDSAIISWTMLFAMFQCADTSPSCYYSFKLWWIFLFLQLWICCNCFQADSFCTLPSHHPLLRWSPPHNGGVCPEMTTKDPLYYHPLAGGFLITFKGITL